MSVDTAITLYALSALGVAGYAWALDRRPRIALGLAILLTPPIALTLYIVAGPSWRALRCCPCWERDGGL